MPYFENGNLWQKSVLPQVPLHFLFGFQKLLVMCNFTKEEQEYTVPETFAGADVLISNYPQSGAAAGARKLRAYEAVVLETK